MKLELNTERFCLTPKQLLKVRGGIGHALVCHSGSVWLTQHRDRRDILLAAGDSFVLDHGGLALVQALEQSAVSLARAAPERRPAASRRASGASPAPCAAAA